MNDDPVVIETGAAPVASVIWLHGLGADGHDFESIVPELNLPEDLPLRFVFPHAPHRPVTINGGMNMRAWYDLSMGEHGLVSNEAHIRESQGLLEKLIAEEVGQGRAPGQIVLAGFSQGGAVALHTALRYPQRLAGIMALSSYLPLHDTLEQEQSEANKGIPLFMAHGLHDPILPFAMAQASRDFMQAHGLNPDWHQYAMEHSVCAQEIADIREWLQGVLRHVC